MKCRQRLKLYSKSIENAVQLSVYLPGYVSVYVRLMRRREMQEQTVMDDAAKAVSFSEISLQIVRDDKH
jgi:hypothetical protein